MKMKIRLLLIAVLGLMIVIPFSDNVGAAFGLDYQYVGSKNSVVYHYPTCDSAQSILDKNKIYFSSAADALSKGYRPCKICTPPKIDTDTVSNTPSLVTVISPTSALLPSLISVKVDSILVPMTDVRPFVETGRTYVPVRAVLEAYGVDSISWNDPFVIVVKGDITLKIPVGQNYIDKNGNQITIDAPALIRDSRTYLPIRAVIESLGGTVGWDSGSQTVMIAKL